MQTLTRRPIHFRMSSIYKYCILLVFIFFIPDTIKDAALSVIYALQGYENSFYFKMQWYDRYERVRCNMLMSTQITIMAITCVVSYIGYNIFYGQHRAPIGFPIWVFLFVAQFIGYWYDLQMYNFVKRMRFFNTEDVSFCGNSTI